MPLKKVADRESAEGYYKEKVQKDAESAKGKGWTRPTNISDIIFLNPFDIT